MAGERADSIAAPAPPPAGGQRVRRDSAGPAVASDTMVTRSARAGLRRARTAEDVARALRSPTAFLPGKRAPFLKICSVLAGAH